MNKDLTVGKPSTILRKFCLPLFGSIIFQQLYNIADSFIAGKFISNDALAAVGNSYEITLILIAFAFGCNIGCSVIVSRLFGAKRMGDLKTAVYTTFISSGVLCALLMVIGLVFSSGLLKLINTPANIISDSQLYLDIYLWGLPFVFFYNISTGIFSALGDSKTPFIFLSISSIANIGVDILFVTALNMGVAGVAWATFICQSISCILAVIFVFRRLAALHTEDKISIFSWPIFKDIAVVAVPSILQQSFISVGNIVIQGVINSFGAGAMAGYSSAVKLNNLVVTSLVTVGNGISNYTAQNIGAGKLSRVREGFNAGLKFVLTISIPIVIIYFVAAEQLISIFLENPTGEALSTGIDFLRIVSPFYIIISVKFVSDSILRGSGMMGKFVIGTFTDLILRVILAIFLADIFGTIGIWAAWPIGWVISTVLSFIFYKTSKYSKVQV